MRDYAHERAIFRVRVLRRDAYRCRMRTSPGRPPCGKPAAFVRRIDPSGAIDLDNLEAVCRDHQGAQ